MITPFDIYLISLADPLNNFFSGAAVLSFFVTVGVAFYFWAEYCEPYPGKKGYFDDQELFDKTKKIYKRKIIFACAITLILFMLRAATPSSETLAAMYVIPKLDTTAMEKLPQAAAKLADEWIKEKVKEISENS